MEDRERGRVFATSKRQWVVAVGKIAEEDLKEKHGTDPSPELVKGYIEGLKQGTPSGADLRRRAHIMIGREFEEEVGRLSKGEKITIPMRNAAEQDIAKRYEELEEDPNRNFSYLDSLLITD